MANKNRQQHAFYVGDLVWLHLRKERYPNLRKNKVMPRYDGQFKIIEKVHDNAFKHELLGDYGVSASFNVGDLTPYVHDDDMAQLRSIVFEEEEDDKGVVDASLLVLVHENVTLDLGSIVFYEGLFMGLTTKVVACLFTNLGVA